MSKPYVNHMLHQQMKGTKWHNATNAKNGFMESAKRYLLSHLKTSEKSCIVLFAVTDINSKNDKYMLSLTLSCSLVTKGHTYTWKNLQLLRFVTTRHKQDKQDNLPRKSILDLVIRPPLLSKIFPFSLQVWIVVTMK